ncbi:MAG TPA: CapA family protein [Solirubrobacteraceae bacterium]|nr:CapA family protein [Solirubrobacteraceae bacterium]
MPTHLRSSAVFGFLVTAPVSLALLAFTLSALASLSPSPGVASSATATPARAAPAPPGRPAAQQPATVTIGWVGDTMLGRAGAPAPDRGRGILAGTGRVTVAPDLMLGNLEGTLSVGGTSKCAAASANCHAFQVPPDHADALHRAGFDLMSLANNHAYDFGETGREQSAQALEESGIASTGGPAEITVLEHDGMEVAVLGFAPYPWSAPLNDHDAAAELVREAREQADLVVVTMHAGAEGSDRTRTPVGTEVAYGENRGDSRRFARAVIDAGADLVLGAGPHVLRGMERYKGRLIAYSLGNYAGWHNFSATAPSGSAPSCASPCARTAPSHAASSPR